MSEQNQKINSRLNKNNRKKKTNTILNVLIGVVLLLIIIVVVNLVTDDNEEKDIASEQKETASVTESKESDEEVPEEEVPEDIELTTEEIAEEDEQNDAANEENDSSTEPSTSGSSNEITEESDDPNVEAVLVDPSWEPIGTSQVGEHVSSYTKETVDWNEKVEALAYAANLDSSNMIVKFLGNGGSPQKSIGTVTSKDGKEIYRISLEWVDGQGWKPTKKEKLLSVK